MESTPEAIPHDPDPHRFEARWQDYRRRSKLFWIIFLSWLPFAVTADIICQTTGWLNHGKDLGSIIFPVWMMFWVPAHFWKSRWRCPQCSKNFFSNGWFRNDFTGRCMHCSLPKWAGSSHQGSKASWWEKLM